MFDIFNKNSIKIYIFIIKRYEEDLEFDFDKLNPELIPESYFINSACKNEFNIDNICETPHVKFNAPIPGFHKLPQVSYFRGLQ